MSNSVLGLRRRASRIMAKQGLKGEGWARDIAILLFKGYSDSQLMGFSNKQMREATYCAGNGFDEKYGEEHSIESMETMLLHDMVENIAKIIKGSKKAFMESDAGSYLVWPDPPDGGDRQRMYLGFKFSCGTESSPRCTVFSFSYPGEKLLAKKVFNASRGDAAAIGNYARELTNYLYGSGIAMGCGRKSWHN